MNDLISAKKVLEKSVVDGASLLCAVSGGLDSMCLLDITHDWTQRHGGAVTAAHFNHGLRGAMAARDEKFVVDYCQSRGIAVTVGRGDTRALVAREGLTVEEAARRLRYEFLENTAAQLGCTNILVAHHADDNAETMLLNLCRGTGAAGMGIPAVRGNILRPFLHITQAEIAAYALKKEIPHVEDETNELDDAARNLLRHKVLPVLKEINPRAVENMDRAAWILARDNEALETLTQKALQSEKKESGFIGISVDTLESLPFALRSRVVLELLKNACGHRKDLSFAHVRAVLELREQQEVTLPYGVLARKNKGELIFKSVSTAPQPLTIIPGETVHFGNWRVLLGTSVPQEGYTYRLASPLPKPLQVTAWRPNDRMVVASSRGARSLKRLWADAGVLPSQRDAMPVLRFEGRPIAAPYLGIDAEFAPNTEATYLTFYEVKGEES